METGRTRLGAVQDGGWRVIGRVRDRFGGKRTYEGRNMAGRRAGAREHRVQRRADVSQQRQRQ